MLAVIQENYGSPARLRLREVQPPAVGDDEVLVRVKAASVHPDVWHVVTGRPFALRLMGSGVRRPRLQIPGTDLAGVVEAVGQEVTAFRPGDEVFGLSMPGFSWTNGGTYAQYASVPQDTLALKPANVTFEQAATTPTTGYILLLNLPRTRLKPGQRVLVNGAGGGVGGLTIQIAKAHGAHVTGVDHTAKLDLMRSLGSDEVIDYTREDFTRGGRRYDVIVDIPANHAFAAIRRALTPGGKYVFIGHDQYGSVRLGRRVVGSIPLAIGLVLLSRRLPSLRGDGSPRLTKKAAMEALREYMEAGQLIPIIDRVYPLAEAGQAISYLAEGKAMGRIVVTP